MKNTFKTFKNGKVRETVFANPTTGDIVVANRNSFGYNVRCGLAQIIYTHPNLLSRLTIKKVNGNIVTCNLIDEQKVTNINGNLVYNIVIVNFNNLVKNS